MKRAAGLEDGQQEIGGDFGVEADPAFDEGTEADISLQDDQRAGFALGEPAHGKQDLIDRFGTPESAGKPTFAADTR